MTKERYVDRLKDDLGTYLDLINLASITAITMQNMKNIPNLSDEFITDIEVKCDNVGIELSSKLEESISELTQNSESNEILLEAILRLFRTYNLSDNIALKGLIEIESNIKTLLSNIRKNGEK